MSNTPPPSAAHTLIEDVYGIGIGCLLVALGLHLLHMAGLITGGIAGLALLASYFVPFSPGTLFALFNLPIFLIFWRMLGTAYIARTTIATLAIMVLVEVVAAQMTITAVSAPMAALVGGTVTGMGVLAVTRHATGVGGLAVVARWLNRHKGWNFGAICMITDMSIVLLAFAMLGWQRGLWSFLSAFATNAVVLVWHRPDRYIAEA